MVTPPLPLFASYASRIWHIFFSLAIFSKFYVRDKDKGQVEFQIGCLPLLESLFLLFFRLKIVIYISLFRNKKQLVYITFLGNSKYVIFSEWWVIIIFYVNFLNFQSLYLLLFLIPVSFTLYLKDCTKVWDESLWNVNNPWDLSIIWIFRLYEENPS